jgi:hypothetical protein
VRHHASIEEDVRERVRRFGFQRIRASALADNCCEYLCIIR